MVDPRRVRQLLDRISDETGHLRRLAALDPEALLRDHDRMHAVKYGFVVTIEAAVDVGRHIIASEGLEAPDTFAQVFAILASSGVIESEVGASMERAARFRNLLVHQYGQVDDNQVVEILRSQIAVFEVFRQQIAASTAAS